MHLHCYWVPQCAFSQNLVILASFEKTLTSEQFVVGICVGYPVPSARRLPPPLETSHYLADLCLFYFEVSSGLEEHVMADTIVTPEVVHINMAHWIYTNSE